MHVIGEDTGYLFHIHIMLLFPCIYKFATGANIVVLKCFEAAYSAVEPLSSKRYGYTVKP